MKALTYYRIVHRFQFECNKNISPRSSLKQRQDISNLKFAFDLIFPYLSISNNMSSLQNLPQQAVRP